MRLKPQESAKLALHCVNLLFQEKDVVFKAPRQKIHQTIETVIGKHFEEERQIDQKAEELFKQTTDGSTDRAKALPLIRKQLAAEKDFILSGGHDGRFTEDKLYHLAHLVADKLYDDDLLDFPDEDDGPKWFKKVIIRYFQVETEAGNKARAKILSQSNAPFEGSKEWEVLYRKYFEEEMRRLGHD